MTRLLPSIHPSRRTLWVLAFLAAVVLATPLVRSAALAVCRFPFIAVRTLAQAVVLLPRVPSLVRENARLRSQLAERHLETAALREQLRYVQAGGDLLARLPSPRGVIARIIGRSTLPMVHTALLDRGTQDGIALESVVLDGSGLVGRVTEARASESVVLLLTDPESRIAALIDRSRESGLLVGQSPGRCRLVYLALQADVQPGDQVVTAGLGGAFPKGLLLGTVVRVERDPSAGTASAWIEPSARLGRLEEVVCVPREGR